MDEGRVKFFSLLSVIAFAIALISDVPLLLGWILAIFLGFLIVPLAILLFVILFHYIAAAMLFMLVFPKLQHLIPKSVFFLATILPLPLLTIGLLVAMLLQNKFIEKVAVQVAIQAIAAVTAGAGEALEAGAVAAKGAKIGAGAVEAAGTKIAPRILRGTYKKLSEREEETDKNKKGEREEGMDEDSYSAAA